MSSKPSARIDDPPGGGAAAGRAKGALDFPSSYAQEQMWFFYQLDPQNVSYNVPLLQRLTGDLDTGALEAAINDLITRHETLRTTFAESSGGLWQIVAERLVVPMPTIDCSALLPGPPEGPVTECESFRARLLEEMRRPFDLEEGPLLRVRLMRLGPADHCLLICVHHIVIDGWSIGVLARELAHAYRARLGGAAPAWTPLEIQYGDYAEWQRGKLDEQSLAEGLAYWRERLAGDLTILPLPTDHPQLRARSFAGDQLDFTLPPELTAGIKELCRNQGATVYMVLLTGFVALLRRYSGQDDILIGTASANRDNTQIEPLIGMFANTLPLRVDASGNPTFAELLRRVRDASLGASAHRHIPLEKIVQEVAPQRDRGGNPLFRIAFALQDFGRSDIEWPGLTASPMTVRGWTSRLDLELHVREQPGGLQGRLAFATDLFERSTAVRMAEALRRVFEAVTADPDRRLGDLPLVTLREQAQLADGFAGGVPYDRDGTVMARFGRQVAVRPEAIAVCDAGGTASYREIDTWSSLLASDLTGAGVSPGSRVALCCGRGLDAVIGLLGVLKAGAVCLPLDGADPPGRLLRLVREMGAAFVLAAGASTGSAAAGGCDGDESAVIDLGSPRYRGRLADGVPSAPEIRIGGGDPALVLGFEPRPVTIGHAELVHQLDLLAAAVGGLTAADTIRCWAPVATQRSVWEMLLPLCHGARMTIARDVPRDNAGA
ncbi:MAG TPA: condensation domain-containing protein, partial [Pseudonocardiaceae bacterium]|nr:condensation domain-containing protein [Pseudonocardiaceae bacterium]